MGAGKYIQATAIVDPTTDKFAVSKHKKIKTVSLEYCKATLANNEACKEYIEEILSKPKQVQKRVSEHIEEFHITKETLWWLCNFSYRAWVY